MQTIIHKIIVLFRNLGHMIGRQCVKLWNRIVSIPYREILQKCYDLFSKVCHYLVFHVVLPKKYRNIGKKRLHSIIFKADTPAGKAFDIWLLVAICFNLFLMMIDSSPRITGWKSTIISIIEWILTILFTLEYYLRIYCSKPKRDYIFSFYGIIDLISILPAYISILIPATQTMTVLRMLRTLRIFRILNLKTYIREGYKILGALQRSMQRIVVFMLFVFVASVILGAVMFMFENGKNPAFSTIPEGIYWAVVTITTVGYGDITPMTHAGRFISMIVMLLGYSIIAVPAGIIVGETINEKNNEKSHQEARERAKRKAEESRIKNANNSSGKDNPTITEEHPTVALPEEIIAPAPIRNKVCPQCGHIESDLSADYCRHCGTQLKDNQDNNDSHQFSLE